MQSHTPHHTAPEKSPELHLPVLHSQSIPRSVFCGQNHNEIFADNGDTSKKYSRFTDMTFH